MRNHLQLSRSVSSYHSPQSSKTQIFRRHISVPSDIYSQELYDEKGECGTPQQPVSDHVMECFEDAAGSFSKVCTTIVQSPETISPEYGSDNFQPRLSDAENLLPDIASLVTNYKPDALPVVKDILLKLQQEIPHLESQYLSFALKAVWNAIILLHLNENDDVHVDSIITQPREIIAAAIMVNKYLNNLTHPTISETRCL